MARLLSLAVLALLASCALAFKWEDCGVVGDAFAVSDVSLSPESVRVGSSAVFTVIGRNGAIRGKHGGEDEDALRRGVSADARCATPDAGAPFEGSCASVSEWRRTSYARTRSNSRQGSGPAGTWELSRSAPILPNEARVASLRSQP